MRESHLRVHASEQSHNGKSQQASREVLGRASFSYFQLPTDKSLFSFYCGAFPGRKAGLSGEKPAVYVDLNTPNAFDKPRFSLENFLPLALENSRVHLVWE